MLDAIKLAKIQLELRHQAIYIKHSTQAILNANITMLAS